MLVKGAETAVLDRLASGPKDITLDHVNEYAEVCVIVELADVTSEMMNQSTCSQLWNSATTSEFKYFKVAIGIELFSFGQQKGLRTLAVGRRVLSGEEYVVINAKVSASFTKTSSIINPFLKITT